MTISRRKLMSTTGKTLAGLSVAVVINPKILYAQTTAGGGDLRDVPDMLVEQEMRKGFPVELPLNPDGSAGRIFSQ